MARRLRDRRSRRWLAVALGSAAAAAIVLVVVATAEAVIIRVPSDVATIQEGLDQAAQGDTVLVEHGTYFENLVWPATQDIKLYADEESPPESTVISGTFAYSPVVDIATPIDGDTEIRCFIIENGRGDYGAGINCSAGASPTITSNLLRNNIAGLNGGAICVSPGTAPLIEGNVIEHNLAVHGGGIYCVGASPTIRANRIRHNEVRSRGIGGGVYIDYGAAVVEHNKITYNKTDYEAAGIYACADSTMIEYNSISFNTCEGGVGGGVFT